MSVALQKDKTEVSQFSPLPKSLCLPPLCYNTLVTSILLFSVEEVLTNQGRSSADDPPADLIAL